MNSEADFPALFTSSYPGGIFAFNQERTIISWNAGMEALFNIPASEAIGLSTQHECLPYFFHDSQKCFVEEALRGRSFTMLQEEEVREGILEITFFPLKDPEGLIVGDSALFKKSKPAGADQ